MGLSRGLVICRVSSRLDGARGLAEEGWLFPGREVLWEEVRRELLDGIIESRCSFVNAKIVFKLTYSPGSFVFKEKTLPSSLLN